MSESKGGKTTEEDAIVKTADGERYRALEANKSGEKSDSG
jgi:hypothetical protein